MESAKNREKEQTKTTEPPTAIKTYPMRSISSIFNIESSFSSTNSLREVPEEEVLGTSDPEDTNIVFLENLRKHFRKRNSNSHSLAPSDYKI